MREQAITLLALWGWEPVERGTAGPVEVILMHRGELRKFHYVGGTWLLGDVRADSTWVWQPCEWARFSTWTLKRCIRMVEERDGRT